MDFFAYFQLYRWLMKGEWVYIRDMEYSICHWCRPKWLQYNRSISQYEVLEYEHW